MTNCLQVFFNRRNVSLFPIIWEKLDFRQFWSILQSGFIMDRILSLASLMKYHHMRAISLHLMTESFLSSFSLSKVISFNLFSVSHVLDFERVLLFRGNWHFLLKNPLYKLAFTKKVGINFLLTRCRIIGLFSPEVNNLSIGQ